jgi:NADH dehydrogenase [ubiquinone] 1 alpha subcomplex assembly factor 7
MTADATLLERELVRIIEAEGPMRLDRYMALCLGHPRHGYYTSRDPFGVAGDFTTAPEISQMFGEIIGIWCMQCFTLIGRPTALDLIELGPGRGTLLADLARASRAMPDFLAALTLRLVETSPALRTAQRQIVSSLGVPATWHESVEEIRPAPTLIIANEFFDALPVRQLQKTAEGWGERVVGLKDGKLALGLVPAAHVELPAWASAAAEGEVVEIRPAADHWAAAIAERLVSHAGAALIIDYGHLSSAPGDTLQALHRHRPAAILDRPGESDLTAHVDFQALGHALRVNGAKVCPPLTQSEFLLSLGLELRASILARNATAVQAQDLKTGVERLAGPREMGHLFKMLAAISPGLPCPHPFGAIET